MCGLQLTNVSNDSIVLSFVHQQAIAGRCVPVLEVAVGPARIRGDRYIMPHDPHLGVITLWRKPSNVAPAGCLADTAEHHERVAVVPRAELDVIFPRTARGTRRLYDLRF